MAACFRRDNDDAGDRLRQRTGQWGLRQFCGSGRSSGGYSGSRSYQGGRSYRTPRYNPNAARRARALRINDYAVTLPNTLAGYRRKLQLYNQACRLGLPMGCTNALRASVGLQNEFGRREYRQRRYASAIRFFRKALRYCPNPALRRSCPNFRTNLAHATTMLARQQNTTRRARMRAVAVRRVQLERQRQAAAAKARQLALLRKRRAVEAARRRKAAEARRKAAAKFVHYDRAATWIAPVTKLAMSEAR